ncbi:putative bifunctional diguanylate cyclase/phosphodiesterase [Peristeroidobacter soli]|uniref:putative bifunctional diguanylate cyclase/phosphodiesterase n=1 Tax=Peristeroidobacter soli TaxID=2497877 RepID=UPI00101B8A4D|nr:EAL domain-containing protein [Peristeroidobacter soli]
MVAFASVAVLAAAANFIVERSTEIVTHSTEAAPPSPPPVVREAVAPPAPVVEVAEPVETLSGDALIRAIERFDESVYSAVQSNSVEALARYRQLGKEVDRATARFMERAEALGETSYKSLPTALQRHKRDADRWIDLSQNRRKLLGEYSETLERMNGRVNASLDGAFKIFGRVVARQSLMKLNTSLSGLRDSFAAAVRSFSSTPEILDPLGKAEAVFAQALLDNGKSLRSAEGDEWFTAMEQDFAKLTAARLGLMKTHQELTKTSNGFVEQTAKLLARMPNDAPAIKKRAAKPAASSAQSPSKGANAHQLATTQPTQAAGATSPAQNATAPGHTSNTSAIAITPVEPMQTPPTISTAKNAMRAAQSSQTIAAESTRPTAQSSQTIAAESTRPTAQSSQTIAAESSRPTAQSSPTIAAESATSSPSQAEEQTDRSLVAWISIAVLVLLFWISIATVRSVVLPVRRLIQASEKLAGGEPCARVPRGGIKELDSLAVAFNNMAERLSHAQAAALNAHHQLEEKVAERTRQLQELAEVDPLTGLPNRRHLFQLLNASLERASRTSSRVGVLFLDVDNFKNINDSIGHSFGDRVLRGIAQRLQAAAQPLGFAARLGGDEFTVICEDVNDLEQIRAASEQIIRAFQTPLDIDGRELIIGVSVGASIYPDHEQNAEALLIAADTALFHTKSLGRGRASMFTPELLAGASNKFRIEQDLRRAIERNEFELFFQPEVSIEDLQTQLVEALIRWRTPDGRYIPPGEFLSVAEESGLIMEISDWVLRTAIRAAAEWHRGPWPQARVAINVSPRQLLDYGFVDRVRELLAEFDVPPRCIEIELTESVLQTGPATIEQLHRLRALGVAIALDDFGTGYSSLSSLERLPLTRVKLDRSLIESIDTNLRSRSIVRAIIDMCNGLGLQVTAEGLERAEQFERFLGCQNLSLQGYLLSRPVAMDQIFTAMASAAQRAQELVLLSKPNAVANVIKQLPGPSGKAASA